MPWYQQHAILVQAIMIAHGSYSGTRAFRAAGAEPGLRYFPIRPSPPGTHGKAECLIEVS